MKTAVKTPTSAVTAKATVGKGAVSPKFCKIKKTNINKKQMVGKNTNPEHATRR